MCQWLLFKFSLPVFVFLFVLWLDGKWRVVVCGVFVPSEHSVAQWKGRNHVASESVYKATYAF